MNKEELIGKLQMVYVGDTNALNELIGYYDGLKQGIEDLQQENKQLKDNWNKLRKYIKEEGFEINTREYGSLDVISKDIIIEKIHESEGSDE